MKYTVVWIPEAERELQNIWLKTEDRVLVSESVNALDSLLTRSPLETGESGLEVFLRNAH